MNETYNRVRLLEKLLENDTGITGIRKKHEQCSEHYRIQNSLYICSDAPCLMEKLEFKNDPEEWGLFINAWKLRLNASLLQNAKVKPSKTASHLVAKNEKYATRTQCSQLQGPLLANMWGS